MQLENFWLSLVSLSQNGRNYQSLGKASHDNRYISEGVSAEYVDPERFVEPSGDSIQYIGMLFYNTASNCSFCDVTSPELYCPSLSHRMARDSAGTTQIRCLA